MPKIIIKEYDNTKSGWAAYENFTVVIPGGLATGKSGSCFDDNGIYECNSQKDFVANIGRIDSLTYTLPAVAPNCANDPQKIDANKFAAWVEESSTYQIYTCTPNTAGTIGYLKTSAYVLTAMEAGATYSATTYYARIEKNKGKEGSDEINIKHMGNQIAYELLGIGYTVLYKKLSTVAEYNQLAKDEYWEPLKDKSEYDFRYIMSGFYTAGESNTTVMNNVNNAMIRLATYVNTTETDNGRGDCLALCDIDESYYKNKSQKEALVGIKTAINSISSSTYAAIFTPHVTYAAMRDASYVNKTFPGTFHYLACAAKARENNFDEWFANAGYTRGISNYVVNSVGCILGEKAVNYLQPRNGNGEIKKSVNPIIKLRDNFYIWGSRTALTLEASADSSDTIKATHLLNIRQLCCTLKKQIYITCRQLTFEPNSDILWINFCGALRSTLEYMKANQGISDYKFIQVKDNKKATLSAKLKIVPIEAVEDFYIGVYLEDSITGNPEIEEIAE